MAVATAAAVTAGSSRVDESNECHHVPRYWRSSRYGPAKKGKASEGVQELTEEERRSIADLYKLRDALNKDAGCIAYHVDHIVPLACGGLHHPENLRVISSGLNIKKLLYIKTILVY